jgi:hypothetical protein
MVLKDGSWLLLTPYIHLEFAHCGICLLKFFPTLHRSCSTSRPHDATARSRREQGTSPIRGQLCKHEEGAYGTPLYALSADKQGKPLMLPMRGIPY